MSCTRRLRKFYNRKGTTFQKTNTSLSCRILTLTSWITYLLISWKRFSSTKIKSKWLIGLIGEREIRMFCKGRLMSLIKFQRMSLLIKLGSRAVPTGLPWKKLSLSTKMFPSSKSPPNSLPGLSDFIRPIYHSCNPAALLVWGYHKISVSKKTKSIISVRRKG